MVGLQEPRIKIVPEGEDHPKWAEIEEFVRNLGYELDPWQWMVLRAATMRAGEVWAAFTIAVCAPRQNGKNTLLEVLELVKAVFLEEKLLIHTAHLADTSKEAFHRLDDAIDAAGLKTKHIWRTNGMETIEFHGGRRIRFRTRTRGGGRGYAGCTTAIFDEAMFLPEVSMGSILPVISASPDPQIFYTGSAVDQQIMEDGVVFARVRDRALKGDVDRMAYFEWSLDVDTPDEVDDELAADPESWAQTNPAFGVRIKPDYVQVERKELAARTFAVERLGVGDWPAVDANVLALEGWDALIDSESEMLDPICLAFDVSPNRRWATIGAAGKRADGLEHVEVVDNRPGTGWLKKRVVEVAKRQRPFAVVCDKASAAASLVPDIEQAGVQVQLVEAREYANACGLIFDAVDQEGLRHLGQKELRDALRGAATRTLGEAWAWSRKSSSVDITPLVACTLALGKSATHFGSGDYLPDVSDWVEEAA